MNTEIELLITYYAQGCMSGWVSSLHMRTAHGLPNPRRWKYLSFIGREINITQHDSHLKAVLTRILNFL